MKAAAAKAKPMLLKSSSIVKGLQRKPGSLPDAKKRKTGRHHLPVLLVGQLLGHREGVGDCVPGWVSAHVARLALLVLRRRQLTVMLRQRRTRQTHPSVLHASKRTSVYIFLCPTPDAESDKPAYLKEMDKYHAMNCSSASGDRPLVK